jgi:hypothetical protein
MSDNGFTFPPPVASEPTASGKPDRLVQVGQWFRGLSALVRFGIIAALALIALAVFAAVPESDSSSNDLIPAHKTLVDNLAADNDCRSLQKSFDDAYDKRGTPGSDKHKRNLALMDYADGAMKRIGCYG